MSRRALQQRAYQARKRLAEVRDGHGTRDMYNSGCRCDICEDEQALREIGQLNRKTS